MKANYVTKMERSSEGKCIEQEVDDKKKAGEEKKLENGDIKRSVGSCVDSLDHHTQKKVRKNQLISFWVCEARDCG